MLSTANPECETCDARCYMCIIRYLYPSAFHLHMLMPDKIFTCHQVLIGFLKTVAVCSTGSSNQIKDDSSPKEALPQHLTLGWGDRI